MQIGFRTDASIDIGSGHVVRCLTLADALAERGAECIFMCRPQQGNQIELVVDRGHKVFPIGAASMVKSNSSGYERWLGTDWQTDAKQTVEALGDVSLDWLVVDHYALDGRWENALKSSSQRVMVIDDLADRKHECDLLLDQNLGRDIQDYNSLIGPSTEALFGPNYAMLRPQFNKMRAQSLARRKHVQLKHIMISMGGVDKEDFTGQVLDILSTCNLPSDMRISVVMGFHAPWLDKIITQSEKMPIFTQVHVGVTNVAALMTDCDLAIGAAGGTAWERCSLGLPSLVFILAENQRPGAAALARAGAVAVIDRPADLKYHETLRKTEHAEQILSKYSQAAAMVTDGLGVDRVVEKMIYAND